VNRDRTAVKLTRATIKLGGSKWDTVLSNATLVNELNVVLLDAFSVQLGLPKRFLRIPRLYLGSLVIELEINRNESFPISDTQIAQALNNNEDYLPTVSWYFIITGDVSSGLLEPVILFWSLVLKPQACDELCVALCSGASIALSMSATTMWYIYYYRRKPSRKERRKRRNLKRKLHRDNDPFDVLSNSETDHEPFQETVVNRWVGSAKQKNDPFGSSLSESDADHEPFNQNVVPPSISKSREPFDHNEQVFGSDASNEHCRSGPFRGLSGFGPYGTVVDCSPFGGPEDDDDFSPSPRRPFQQTVASVAFEDDDNSSTTGNMASNVEVLTISSSTVAQTRWWWQRRLAETSQRH
jgi:hypothetical protein